MTRLWIRVCGLVQGVGFRPFVFRLATGQGWTGWVRNRSFGVEIEVQGTEKSLVGFPEALSGSPARIDVLDMAEIEEVCGEKGFTIAPSLGGEGSRPSVPADRAMCPRCAQEMSDPAARRYRYPFTNCTECGPRYSILEALPYDRPHTSMRSFPMCPSCQEEYAAPEDRRFHAQPIACPVCGPQLRLLDRHGKSLAREDAALRGAVRALLQGEVLALKGLGGFQLLVDATSSDAVAQLRKRKHRDAKPFAVMFPDLDQLRRACHLSDGEKALLVGPEAPILLLKRKDEAPLSEAIAPGLPRMGALLPYTPLHRLLLESAGRPLVCTSGNRSEEPMAITDAEARERLDPIADLFLTHDRPIVRPVDDSLLRLDGHGPTMVRRARGYAPQAHPVALEGPPVLALGAHQKNTITILAQGQALVSQHIGDLVNAHSVRLLEKTVQDLLGFLGIQPLRIICDLHPDYASTRLGERLARQWELPLMRVQHHQAHVAAVAAERGLREPVLGLVWDGSGLGCDGTLWGGEALRVDGTDMVRMGHLRSFQLPGGDKVAREPRRSAAGLLWACLGPEGLDRIQDRFAPAALNLLGSMLERSVNSPLTTSVGRLFDAVSALLGLCGEAGFEGQPAMLLEAVAEGSEETGGYPWRFESGERLIADPTPLVRELLADLDRQVPLERIARRFHHAMADMALAQAFHAGLSKVVLSGGCFQNALLSHLVRTRLQEHGFDVVLPSSFPPNDGAISLGQAWVGAQA